MLALKLFLVPAFLGLLALAARRFSPQTVGWLSALPVVAGPILFVIALENGAAFASQAAMASTAAVAASVSFSVTYARVAQRRTWIFALALAISAWFAVACLLNISGLARSVFGSCAVALCALVFLPRFFPRLESDVISAPKNQRILVRMFAGAALTVVVSFIAKLFGSSWSGLFSVFPVLSSILAVFSHRSFGAPYATTLLRGMALGMSSFVFFSAALSHLLLRTSTLTAFASALLLCVFVHAAVRWFFVLRKAR